MDPTRFDTVIRALIGPSSRRGFLPGFAVTLGLALLRPPAAIGARKRKKPLRRNAFGCVPVGKPCRGKDEACCSGICRGKRPKQGKKDRSRCVDHDASTCQAGSSPFGCAGSDVFCATTAGQDGVCATTTGSVGYCADDDFSTICSDCTKDSHCQDVSGNPSAACIRCASCGTGNACAFAF